MKSKRIAYAGMIIALCIISLFFASFVPKGKSLFYIISSLSIMIIIWLFDIKLGLSTYIAASILSFFLIPNKITFLVFALFAGLYPIMKALFERGLKVWLEFLLKFTYLNISLIIFYLLFKIILKLTFDFKYQLWIIFLSIQFIFILYDYLLTRLLAILKQHKILEGMK